jgi:hypothetical protein
MSDISLALRRQIIARAGGCCEYCQISSEDDLLPFEIDHIIAIKHRGESELNNLANSCYRCNHFKGTDIGSIDPATGSFSGLYNPRKHKWREHFRLNDAEIEPLTPEGRVTVFILQFNHPERVAERELAIKLGRYPCMIP